MNKLVCLLLFGSNLIAYDEYIGQKYYQVYLAPFLGYNGAIFAKKYTSDEWDTVLISKATLQKNFDCPKCDIDDETLGHIKAFAKFFAKDSSATPTCD